MGLLLNGKFVRIQYLATNLSNIRTKLAKKDIYTKYFIDDCKSNALVGEFDNATHSDSLSGSG